MDSFQPSRGRTFFEVLCALALAASLAGAWAQTGASALLAASAAAALFGLSHAVGMRRPRAVAAAEPQRIDFTTDAYGDVAVGDEAGVVPMVAEPEAVVVPMVAAPEPEPAVMVEPEIALEPTAKAARATKAPRKGRARKKADEATAPSEEPVHVQLDRLFEPEPFARHQHAVFGRRHTLR